MASDRTAITVAGLGLLSNAIYRNRRVLKSMWQNPSQMGEIAPFSAPTIYVLLRPVDKMLRAGRTCSVLEVGSGDGGVTRELLKLHDEFPNQLTITCVELDESFCHGLRTLIDGRATLHCPQNILDHTGQYDALISTMPEQNMPGDILTDIFAQFQRLVKPDGILQRVRYVVQWKHIWALLPRERRKQFQESAAAYTAFEKRFPTTRVLIVRNVPPVHVLMTTMPST